MMAGPPKDEASNKGRSRLDSWKEIATYLARDLRTVQRWEKREGLPVHRHMHDKRGSVFAYSDELDQWKSNRTDKEKVQPRSQRRSAKILAALAGLALIVVVAGLRSRAVTREDIGSAVADRLVPRVLAGFLRNETKRIPLPKTPGEAILSKDGRYAFAVSGPSASITVLDLVEARALREIPVGGRPHSIEISTDATTLFLGDITDGIHVVDLASGTTRTIPAGGGVRDIELSPDGKRLYLAMAYHGLKRLEISTGRVENVPGVVCPVHLAADSGGNQLWISCRCGGPGGRPGHDYIDVLDFSTERSIKAIGGPPIVGGHIVLSPDRSLVAIDGGDACESPRYDHTGCPAVPSGVIHVFRRSDDRLLRTFATPTQGFLAFTSNGLVHSNTKQISLFDTRSSRITESIADDAFYLYFSRVRPELYARSDHEWRIIPLPPAQCSVQPSDLNRQLTADGTNSDVRGAAHAILSEVQYRPGILGQAFQLDGRASFLEVAHDQSWRLAPPETNHFWLKPERTGTEEVLIENVHADRSLDWRLMRLSDERIALEVALPGDKKRIVSRDRVTAGEWSSVAMSVSEMAIDLFVNGQHQSSLSGRYESAGGGRCRIGAGFRGSHYAGLLDEITRRTTALSPEKARALQEEARICSAAKW